MTGFFDRGHGHFLDMQHEEGKGGSDEEGGGAIRG